MSRIDLARVWSPPNLFIVSRVRPRGAPGGILIALGCGILFIIPIRTIVGEKSVEVRSWVLLGVTLAAAGI